MVYHPRWCRISQPSTPYVRLLTTNRYDEILGQYGIHWDTIIWDNWIILWINHMKLWDNDWRMKKDICQWWDRHGKLSELVGYGILYIAQCKNDHCECGYCGIQQMDIFMGNWRHCYLFNAQWVNQSHPKPSRWLGFIGYTPWDGVPFDSWLWKMGIAHNWVYCRIL